MKYILTADIGGTNTNIALVEINASKFLIKEERVYNSKK